MGQEKKRSCIWVAFNPVLSDNIWYKQAGLGIKEVVIDELVGRGVDLSFFERRGEMFDIDLSYDDEVTKIEIL